MDARQSRLELCSIITLYKALVGEIESRNIGLTHRELMLKGTIRERFESWERAYKNAVKYGADI